ncbi:MAG: hypothetical protein Q4D51_08755 [Eubacteriales bacterium]|nr:hypothetical protein [Eubacteriales bacterium]
MMELDQNIKRFVTRVKKRQSEKSIITNLIEICTMGLIVANILCGIALIVPFYASIILAAIVIGGCVIAGWIRGIQRTPTMEQSALLVDAKGYQEKISTALFLNGRNDAFATLQKKDAIKITEHFDIRKEFPIRIGKKQMLVFISLAFLFLVCSTLDTPAKRIANMRHEVTKEAKEEIAKLEKLEKELKDKHEISETEMAELSEQLKNAKKELKEADSSAELAKMKERLAKKMELAADKSKNKGVSDTLKKAAEETRKQEQDKKDQLAKEALEALEKAKNGNKKDQKKAYEKMAELAAQMSDDALQQAADNYQEAQPTDASYAEAKNAVQNAMNQQLNSQNASNQNGANQNASNQNASNQSASNQNATTGQMASNQQNQANQNGPGNAGNNGNGNGNGGGNGKGNGSGNGNGPGAGWNYGSKDGREGAAKTDENITVPDGMLGNDDNLTGKANGNDSSIRQKSNESKAWSGNKVSYGSVSGQYKQKAYTKVNESGYPSDMKDKIKNYFDGLN